MTRLGKCEMCRNRKVKCDETRPSCGACRKKSRPCVYKPKKDSIHTPVIEQVLAFRVGYASNITAVPRSPKQQISDDIAIEAEVDHLGVKHARQAASGDGTFFTLGLSRTHRLKRDRRTRRSEHLVPSTAILCPQSEASARWATVFGYDALGMNPLGDYLKLALIHAPESKALELASHYALDSMSAFYRSDNKALIQAHKSGARALASLRATVETCRTEDDSRNLILAILLHYAAEHFLQLDSFDYVPHMLALRYLLKLHRTRYGSDTLLADIASSFCMDEVIESIMYGRDSSIFENTFDLHLASTLSSNTPVAALEMVGHLLVQLPRLVYLVRQITQEQDATQVVLATKRALAVLGSDADKHVQEYLKVHTKQAQGLGYDTIPPFGTFLEFDLYPSFLIAVRYNLYRMIICGLLGKLWSHGCHCNFNIVAIEQAEIEAAKSTMMCLHYAMQPSPSRPLTALKMIIPIQIAVGTWLRLAKREAASPDEAFENINWIFARLDEIGSLWRYRSADLNRLAVICDMFVGGPFAGNRARPEKPAACNAGRAVGPHVLNNR